MGQHAILSASASKRWMNCTPSALLEKQFADEESIYAAEGTAAHALAEHKLKRFLKKRSKRPVSDYDCDEMEECTDDYVSFAMEQIEKAKQSCSDPVVMIEQRLDFSRWVPEGFGTGDLVIVADDTLYIVDLKYGKGIAVSAEWNPQMLLYSLGALAFGWLRSAFCTDASATGSACFLACACFFGAMKIVMRFPSSTGICSTLPYSSKSLAKRSNKTSPCSLKRMLRPLKNT